MAASSNSGGGKSSHDRVAAHPNPTNNTNTNASGVNNNNNNNNSALADNSIGLQTLKHDPVLALEWTADEQSILEENLNKFNGEQNLLKYVKIATLLPEKTVRDVALRCRWMSKKESGKRRKAEEQNSTKKIKDRKHTLQEKTVDPSAKPAIPPLARSAVPVFPQLLPVDNDDGISYEAIGGTTGQLLQQNAHVFSQISANLQAYQIQENIELFCRTRSNIAIILNEMNDMPGIMSQMPPLPAVNDALADTILPKVPQVSAPLQS